MDIDLHGQPCGAKAAFAHQRNRKGRQLGRVGARWYNEIVVDQLYPGNTVLPAVLQEVVNQAEQVLALELAQRQRTILRIDGHGGSQDDVNWVLEQGYQIHPKEYSGKRAQTLADSVTHWYQDPRHPGRQVGWVTAISELTAGEIVPIDGKTLRRSQDKQLGKAAIHLISA